MSKEIIFEKVQSLVSEALDIDRSLISLESAFRRDLGADSLDSLEVVMSVEDAFSVEFDEEAASKINTVQDLVTYIERYSSQLLMQS